MENILNEEILQQIDAQTEELEQRFNQFIGEIEEDFDFTAMLTSKDQKNKSDDRSVKFDSRLANIEERYGNAALKHNVVLGLSGFAMLCILCYLGYLMVYR